MRHFLEKIVYMAVLWVGAVAGAFTYYTDPATQVVAGVVLVWIPCRLLWVYVAEVPTLSPRDQ